jgi:threonine aldolase
MQLASKMRFVSAQLIALLEGDLYLRNARHANAMAQRLRSALEAGIADGSIQGVGFTQQTQSNGVFATLPNGVADRLRETFRFYDWDAARNEVRWMRLRHRRVRHRRAGRARRAGDQPVGIRPPDPRSRVSAAGRGARAPGG